MLKRLSTIRVLLLVTAGVLVHSAVSAGTDFCDAWDQQYPGCNYNYDSVGQCCLPEVEDLMCPQDICLG